MRGGHLAFVCAALTVAGPASAQAARDTAVVAGGCFWGIQYVFEHVIGVTGVTSGYAGGKAGTADYETVSSGTTGHAESVRIVFDPARVSYRTLLDVFFLVAHDPTEVNRQGPDEGTQYRSAIFYTNADQQRVARETIARLVQAHAFRKPIATEVSALAGFYPAEAYHQDYAWHHPDEPYIAINDLPKATRLKERFPRLYFDPSRQALTPAGR